MKPIFKNFKVNWLNFELLLFIFCRNHCTLYAFLMDYIKDVFLGQIHVDNGNKTIIELKHKFVKFFLMLTIILLFFRRLIL